jgi:hypothetical protein
MSHDLRPASSVRESAGDASGGAGGSVRAIVWRALPSERAVSRSASRLLGVGIACLAAGLPGLARLAARGSAPTVRSGVLAVGYACLALAAAVPAAYWATVLGVGVGTLWWRRAAPVWKRLRTVTPERVTGPEGRLRF